MRHISLFSGIGGFDLAAHFMGWDNVAHCEWNPFCQKILKYHFPKAKSYSDITKTSFKKYHGSIDIISGGFPCQPYSVAGKRKGTEDSRHLWPEMLRVIREVSPKWVVGENVLGLVNWDGGLVFEQVQTDLEAEGYQVQAYVLPACGVDAPHKRDRVWFVAYAGDKSRRSSKRRTSVRKWELLQSKQKRCSVWSQSTGLGGFRPASYSYHKRRSARLGQVCKANGEVSQWNQNAESCNSSEQINANTNRTRFQKARAKQQTTRTKQYRKLDFRPSQNPHRYGWRSYIWKKQSSKWKFRHTGSANNIGVRADDGEIGLNTNTSSKLQQRNESGKRRTKRREVLQQKNWETNTKQSGTVIETGNATNTQGQSSQRMQSQQRKISNSKSKKFGRVNCKNGSFKYASNANYQGLQRSQNQRILGSLRKKRNEQPARRIQSDWSQFPTQSPVCSRNDGLSYELDGITFSKWRQESIKTYGNAIVPEVVLQIFKAINQFEKL